QDQGLPVALAVRILRKYGSAAEQVVREQPYRLAAEVYGISFQVADSIAARSGVPPEAPQRIGAGISAVLREAAASGHVFLPMGQLLPRAAKLLSLPPKKVQEAMPQLGELGYFDLDDVPFNGLGMQKVAYLPDMHTAEVSIGEVLTSLQQGRDRLRLFVNLDWEMAWRYLGSRETVHLTEQHRDAV